MIKSNNAFARLLLLVRFVIDAYSHQASVVALFARSETALLLFGTNLKVGTTCSSSRSTHLYLIFGTVLEVLPRLGLLYLSFVDLRWINVLLLV